MASLAVINSRIAMHHRGSPSHDGPQGKCRLLSRPLVQVLGGQDGEEREATHVWDARRNNNDLILFLGGLLDFNLVDRHAEAHRDGWLWASLGWLFQIKKVGSGFAVSLWQREAAGEKKQS